MPEMFDETLRRLREMSGGVHFTVSLPLDDDGYLDRKCPSHECGANFKTLFEDWKTRVKDEVVYCPICRHEAAATEWNTLQQRHHIKQAALGRAKQMIGSALRTDVERFNREQPVTGFLRITMSYSPGSATFVLPIQAAELMTQRFVCEVCECRYASVGAAFFCPACGHNSALTTFDASVRVVRQLLASLPSVKKALSETGGLDASQETVRQLLENSLVKLAGSLQRFAEAVFASLPQGKGVKYRRNLFQNILESSALWRTATGRGYEEMLSGSEFEGLNRLFQQRHLLVHREGIVDQDYIDRTDDPSYRVGQRIVVREETVILMADLVAKLAASLSALK